MLNDNIDNNIKYLEQKIDQVINLINSLKLENQQLKHELSELKDINNQAVEKINFILDNISKLL